MNPDGNKSIITFERKQCIKNKNRKNGSPSSKIKMHAET